MNKFENVIETIDYALGEGYAKEHPILVGQTMIADALYNITESMENAIVSVGSLSSIISLFKSKK